MAETESKKWPILRGYLICYALYILLIIPGTVAVFLLWRNAILVLLAVFMKGNQANQLIYLASMALLGLGAFILVMAAGPYLHNGTEKQLLLRRFQKLALPLVFAAVLALLVLTII